jgi:uncharacterized membrane protein
MHELLGLLLYAFFASWAIFVVVNLKDLALTSLARFLVAAIAFGLMYISGVFLYVFV